MKTIRKNFLLLAFAAGALFLIGNNVFANDPTTPGHDTPGGGGVIAPEVCSSSTLCNPHFTDYVRPYDGMRFCCSNNVPGQRGKAKK
jgi:hypothetical protein